VEVHGQDIVVALKLAFDDQDLSYAELGNELGLSASQVHVAVKRAAKANLLVADSRKVNRQALLEFLVHGLKFVFPAKRGPIVRGMPTAHSAPPLNKSIATDGTPVVWPDPEGDVQGESIEPLHKGVPNASRRDPQLYESLALVDAIRLGSPDERKIATEKLSALMKG
jgi:hypothetical protein